MNGIAPRTAVGTAVGILVVLSDIDAQFRADLASVFAAEFSVSATLLLANQSPLTVSGIFDETGVELDLDSGVMVPSATPQLMVPTHLLTAKIQPNDKVMIQGRTYQVSQPPIERHGVTTIYFRSV